MIIQDVIGDIVSSLVVAGSSPSVSPTYVHGSSGWQNLEVDEIQNDVIILDEPVVSNDTYHQSGLLEEDYSLRIFFLTKSEFDTDFEQQKPLLASQRAQRRKFIDKLSQRTDIIRSISNIKTTDLINVLNVNLTGVMLSITIRPINVNPIC